MKFTRDQARKFSWEGLSGWAYTSKKDFPSASAAYFEVTTAHGRVKTTISDRIYYVVEGEGTFTINENMTTVVTGDVVVVPKNTPYDYKTVPGKTLKLFLVHCPAYDAAGEQKMEIS